MRPRGRKVHVCVNGLGLDSIRCGCAFPKPPRDVDEALQLDGFRIRNESRPLGNDQKVGLKSAFDGASTAVTSPLVIKSLVLTQGAFQYGESRFDGVISLIPGWLPLYLDKFEHCETPKNTKFKTSIGSPVGASTRVCHHLDVEGRFQSRWSVGCLPLGEIASGFFGQLAIRWSLPLAQRMNEEVSIRARFRTRCP